MGPGELMSAAMVLVLMFAAVGAKVVTGQMLARMKHQITHVAHIKQEALNRLKVAQSQHAIYDQNKMVLNAKKMKVLKRLNRLKSEMSTIAQDDEARKQRSNIRKVDRSEST